MTDTVLAGGDRDSVARTPAPSTGASRPVRRRQSLPTGRAVVGGFLVALSALGIFVAYTRVTAEPATRYVVARQDLRVGAQILPGDVALLPMELPRAVIDRKVVFTSASGVVGATVLSPVRAGELLQASDLVRKGSGEGDVEVSFAIDAARAVAGELAPGERVDVVTTVGTGPESFSLIVVGDALVLRVDKRSATLGDESTVVMLALPSRDDAVALSHAVTTGEITLIRTTGARAGSTPPPYRTPAGAGPGGRATRPGDTGTTEP